MTYGDGIMYKVVIIDDEPIIVEGLSRVIKWEEYGCRLAGTAYDGLDGVNVIRELKPDIIFSDIAMPGMDGLKMIAAIRVEQPDAMIAILTGYRDFDYAQTAIRLGVCRFHYAEKITLSELADKMYVSQWHLSKLLNKHTKKSFSELLNEIRVKEAKQLLKDPSLRVGDVAEMVGFLDIAHFSRVFKKCTEMSANEYRNKKLG